MLYVATHNGPLYETQHQYLAKRGVQDMSMLATCNCGVGALIRTGFGAFNSISATPSSDPPHSPAIPLLRSFADDAPGMTPEAPSHKAFRHVGFAVCRFEGLVLKLTLGNTRRGP